MKDKTMKASKKTKCNDKGTFYTPQRIRRFVIGQTVDGARFYDYALANPPFSFGASATGKEVR